MLPGCWDGVNLDSANHKSHMAFPAGVDNGLCPPSHPVHLITIFYEVLFNVAHFNGLNDGGRFVLANGDPTGYGLHADFMNGWDSSVLSRAVSTCTAASGQIRTARCSRTRAASSHMTMPMRAPRRIRFPKR